MNRRYLVSMLLAASSCGLCPAERPRVEDLPKMAAPALAGLFSDDELRPAASDELERRGPAAADAEDQLVRQLGSEKWLTRLAAVRALGKVSQTSKAAADGIALLIRSEPRDSVTVEVVLGMAYETLAGMQNPLGAEENAVADLHHNKRALRMMAAYYLGRISVHCADTVPEALASVLHDPDYTVRKEAAIAMGCFGARAASAKSRLTALLDDENPEVVKAAEAALLKIQRNGQ